MRQPRPSKVKSFQHLNTKIEIMNMAKIKAYAAQSVTSPIAAATIPRREPTPRDVKIEILFCGICHSDLHYARNEWSSLMQTVYPCVPGHEIVGRVTRVGSAVTKYKLGDLAGVGCLVDADCPARIVARATSSFVHPGLDVWRDGQTPRPAHLRRLFGKHRRGRALRAPRAWQSPARRSRALAVRRHHDLFAAAPLESRPGPESWHRRSRRSRPHGREVRPRLRRACRGVHHFARARRTTRSVLARTRSFSHAKPKR